MTATHSPRRIVVLCGHPLKDSYCASLARAYAEGAREAGHEVRECHVADCQFDPLLRHGYRERQPLEPDLLRLQQDLVWAEHLVIAFPVWWGTPPALLKGLFDRLFLPGFAYQYTSRSSPFPNRLLAGRSARILCTMDSPPWYYRLCIGAPGVRMMRRSLLGFCGYRPVRVSLIGSVRFSSPERRAAWCASLRRLGSRCR